MDVARGAMVTKIYQFHKVPPILPTLQKRSYYGWVNMVTSSKRKQYGLPPQSFLAKLIPATNAVYYFLTSVIVEQQ